MGLESLFSYSQFMLEQYDNLLLVIVLATIVSFVLTPITGVIAKKMEAVDKPPSMRSKRDRTRFRRIHKNIMPNLGGLAIWVAFLTGVFWSFQRGLFAGDEFRLGAILLGMSILAIMGIIDARYEISAKSQLLTQVFAAIIVVLAGIKIENIEILNLAIQFDAFSFGFQLLGETITLAPLADIITIIWIVGLVNAMNWVAGLDALAGFIGVFAAITLMFIGVKFEVILAALLAASLAGSILGFLPFNFPPARTYSGTSGDMLMGYMLAILAIISGAKLTAGIIVLALPILDAIWVVVGRYRRHKDELNSIFEIVNYSDKTHLHHRLLDIGLSKRQVLLVEVTIFVAFCLAAYAFAGFREEALLAIAAVLVGLIIFSIIAILRSRALKRKKEMEEQSMGDNKRSKVEIEEQTPEEKYAY